MCCGRQAYERATDSVGALTSTTLDQTAEIYRLNQASAPPDTPHNQAVVSPERAEGGGG